MAIQAELTEGWFHQQASHTWILQIINLLGLLCLHWSVPECLCYRLLLHQVTASAKLEEATGATARQLRESTTASLNENIEAVTLVPTAQELINDLLKRMN